MLMTIFFFLTSLGTSLHLPLSLQCCAQKRTRFLPFCLKFIVSLAGGGREEVASFTYITGKFQHFFTSTVASVEVAFRLNVKHLS